MLNVVESKILFAFNPGVITVLRRLAKSRNCNKNFRRLENNKTFNKTSSYFQPTCFSQTLVVTHLGGGGGVGGVDTMGNEEDVEELRLVESVDEEDGILVKLFFLFFRANSAISLDT